MKRAACVIGIIVASGVSAGILQPWLAVPALIFYMIGAYK